MRKFLALSLAVLFFGSAEPACAVFHRTGEDESDKAIEAKMPPEWRACDSASDCGLVRFACSGVIAANKQYVNETGNLAYKTGGDPATIDCPLVNHTEPNYVTTCLNNQCFAINPIE